MLLITAPLKARNNTNTFNICNIWQHCLLIKSKYQLNDLYKTSRQFCVVESLFCSGRGFQIRFLRAIIKLYGLKGVYISIILTTNPCLFLNKTTKKNTRKECTCIFRISYWKSTYASF